MPWPFNKKKKEVKPRYSAPAYNEQTPEEKLSQALRSQGRGSKSLTQLLESMRSPTEIERNTDMFNSSRSFTPGGRAFQNESGNIRYQPPSDTEGEFLGSGRRVQRGDIPFITGGRSRMSNSSQAAVAKMLEDPAIMRFFMDIYGESGKQKNSRITGLNHKGSGCKPGGKGVGMDSSCDPKKHGKSNAYN